MMTLTPEANAEVKRNLRFRFGLMAGVLLLVSILLFLIINPPDPLVLCTIFFVACSLPLAVMGVIFLTLAYPMGCWPGLLGEKWLMERYGIKVDGRWKGGRNWKGQASSWSAFSRGAAIPLAFGVLLFLADRGMGWGHFHRYWMLIFYLTLGAGNLSARAWEVRRQVAERDQDVYFVSQSL